MAEQGVLPEDDNKLIRKLEAFLGVVLIKRKKVEREKIDKIITYTNSILNPDQRVVEADFGRA